MQHIINFLIKNKNFILFLMLLFISLVFTIQSHQYHKSKFINSANWFYSKLNNIILVNKGVSDSIKTDMGVITSDGIIGVIDQVGGNNATVISILNSISQINAGLKNTNHFGTLTWNGKDPNVVQLDDLEKLASFKENDTIITGGNSTLFPKGIPIGIVKNFKLNTKNNLYDVNVQLFNDMTSLEHVYIIENLHREEIDNLLAPKK